MKELFLGIDPGKKGGLVVTKGNELIDWVSFHKIWEEVETEAVIINPNQLKVFLKPYIDHIETASIELPLATVFGNKRGGNTTTIKAIADLRGMAMQLYQFFHPYLINRRLVSPRTWQAHFKFKKTKEKDIKQVVQDAFKILYPDVCKFQYEWEGIADSYYISLWGHDQNPNLYMKRLGEGLSI